MRKFARFFGLLGEGLADQTGVDLGVLDLDDADRDLAAREGLQVVGQLLDLGTLQANDLAGTRGLDDDGQFLARALDVHIAHGREGRRAVEALVHVLADLVVLDQQLAEQGLGCEPAALVSLGHTDAETEWMDFLSHGVFLSGRPRQQSGDCCA